MDDYSALSGMKPLGERRWDLIKIKLTRRTDMPDSIIARTQLLPREIHYTFVRGEKVVERNPKGTYPYDPLVWIQYHYYENEIMMKFYWQGEDGRPIEEVVITDKLVVEIDDDLQIGSHLK